MTVGASTRRPFAVMERCGYNPEVGKEIPLADAPKAHEAVMKPGAYGKIVLIPSS